MVSSEEILSAVGAEKLSSKISSFSVSLLNSFAYLLGFSDFFASSRLDLHRSAMVGICCLVFMCVFVYIQLKCLLVFL